jgi:type II secretory pathway component GspD/PulD (secretin)
MILNPARSSAGGRIGALSVLLLALITAGCQGKPAAPSTPAPTPPIQIANAGVINALSQPTEMEFVETPLKDFIEALKIRHGITIEVDTQPLADVGITSDTPITYAAKGITLNAALAQVLQQRKLSYVIDHGVLLITTAAKAKEMDR